MKERQNSSITETLNILGIIRTKYDSKYLKQNIKDNLEENILSFSDVQP
jgi:hypothetical protein